MSPKDTSVKNSATFVVKQEGRFEGEQYAFERTISLSENEGNLVRQSIEELFVRLHAKRKYDAENMQAAER